MKYDVIIIGAGVIGSAIARKLSQYKLKILVLEKENEDIVNKVLKGINAEIIPIEIKEIS